MVSTLSSAVAVIYFAVYIKEKKEFYLSLMITTYTVTVKFLFAKLQLLWTYLWFDQFMFTGKHTRRSKVFL